MAHYCNVENCTNYENQVCTVVGDHYTVDRQCVLYRKRKRDDDYRELMRPAFNSGCHATQSGFKANHGKVIK